MARKPKLAVWKFASCDGCQLSVLSCEDELLTLANQIEIAYFREASSAVIKGPYDLSLVEGSITTEHDAERIQKDRKSTRLNSSHLGISYAVFCLKKKRKRTRTRSQ